ncbi:MAG: hypothetical protein HY902_03005 [Deltaproteobacteria bacterium]|nr:hypothetical protein [Deltaproteobacteria bacterium]
MGFKRIPAAWRAPLAALLAVLAAGCSSPADGTTTASGDATTGGDTSLDTSLKSQYYAASYTFHGGAFAGQTFQVERDLTQTSGVLSFGNSHLAYPAVAFAIEDQADQVVKGADGKWKPTKLALQLRFGILVPGPGFPVNTGAAGTYPLGCKPPMIQVVLATQMYRSSCPLAAGSGDIVVSSWAAEKDGHFAGTFKGRAYAYNYNSSYLDDCNPAHTAQTCKQPEIWVDVQGAFDFTLPGINADVCLPPAPCP